MPSFSFPIFPNSRSPLLSSLPGYFHGGGEGNRTPVRKNDHSSFSERSLCICFRPTRRFGALAKGLLRPLKAGYAAHRQAALGLSRWISRKSLRELAFRYPAGRRPIPGRRKTKVERSCIKQLKRNFRWHLLFFHRFTG